MKIYKHNIVYNTQNFVLNVCHQQYYIVIGKYSSKFCNRYNILMDIAADVYKINN